MNPDPSIKPAKQQDTNNDEVDYIELNEDDLTQLLMSVERSAPLPDPNEMRGYQEIDPQIPNKIISMAEKEQYFRHISTYLRMIMFPTIVTVGLGISAYTALYHSRSSRIFKAKEPRPPKEKKD